MGSSFHMDSSLLREYSENGIGVVMDAIEPEDAKSVIDFAHSISSDPNLPPIHKGHQNDDGSLASNPMPKLQPQITLFKLSGQYLVQMSLSCKLNSFLVAPAPRAFLAIKTTTLLTPTQ
jgi:hypothetical protein